MDEVGCDFFVDVFLDVLFVLISEMNVMICMGEFYSFVGINYIIVGIYQVIYMVDGGCDSIVILNFDVIISVNEMLDEIICDGEFFIVGGDDFDVMGSYIIELVVDNGCDFIVIFNFNVLEVIIEDDSVSICDGDIYMYDGNDYIMSGVYDYFYIVFNGCDSIYCLILIVLFNLIQMIDLVICFGDIFSFGGNDYIMIDIYVVILFFVNGCDFVIIINLIV